MKEKILVASSNLQDPDTWKRKMLRISQKTRLLQLNVFQQICIIRETTVFLRDDRKRVNFQTYSFYFR